jgi:hypothetical protein
MNVGAVGAVAGGIAPVYAALSPYLNGVQRLSNAAVAAQLSAAATSAAATAAAVAAPPAAASTGAVEPPFLNPAIAEIAARMTLAEVLTAPVAITPLAPPPASATDPVLYGDSGLLIQSYGAVALLTGPLNAASVYGLPVAPAVPAIGK